MTLTLVSVEWNHIVREDEDGQEILSTPGPIFVPMFRREDYDLSSAWFAAVTDHRLRPPADRLWSYRPDRFTFAAKVLREITDADDATIVWCESCEDPHWQDQCQEINGGDSHACESCYEDQYRGCDECGNVVYYENMTYTLSEESVCSRCSDRHYSYCEDCDGYYHDSYSEIHDHGGCDCESPAQHFAMRNSEGTTLSADERMVFSLPSGVISEEGMAQIASLVRGYYYDLPMEAEDRNKWWQLSHKVPTMDPRWQTKEGNFTKRLSKLAHKSHALKFPPELLTKVGNVARDNSNGADVNVELTRNLNLSAADFFHEDSCWWQSYSESRCALKSNGGIGMRTFTTSMYGEQVSGRAWIMPLRTNEDGNLSATFDAETADAYMVFNGYGDLDGYTPARIVSHMAGMTYRKIGFDCSPMYVNNGSGYLVAPEEIAAKYTDGHLSLYVDTHSMLHHREQAQLAAA